MGEWSSRAAATENVSSCTASLSTVEPRKSWKYSSEIERVLRNICPLFGWLYLVDFGFFRRTVGRKTEKDVEF